MTQMFLPIGYAKYHNVKVVQTLTIETALAAIMIRKIMSNHRHGLH